MHSDIKSCRGSMGILKLLGMVMIHRICCQPSHLQKVVGHSGLESFNPLYEHLLQEWTNGKEDDKNMRKTHDCIGNNI